MADTYIMRYGEYWLLADNVQGTETAVQWLPVAGIKLQVVDQAAPGVPFVTFSALGRGGESIPSVPITMLKNYTTGVVLGGNVAQVSEVLTTMMRP